MRGKKLITSITIDANTLRRLDALAKSDRRVRGDEIAILIDQEYNRRKEQKAEMVETPEPA